MAPQSLGVAGFEIVALLNLSINQPLFLSDSFKIAVMKWRSDLQSVCSFHVWLIDSQ